MRRVNQRSNVDMTGGRQPAKPDVALPIDGCKGVGRIANMELLHNNLLPALWTSPFEDDHKRATKTLQASRVRLAAAIAVMESVWRPPGDEPQPLGGAAGHAPQTLLRIPEVTEAEAHRNPLVGIGTSRDGGWSTTSSTVVLRSRPWASCP